MSKKNGKNVPSLAYSVTQGGETHYYTTYMKRHPGDSVYLNFEDMICAAANVYPKRSITSIHGDPSQEVDSGVYEKEAENSPFVVAFDFDADEMRILEKEGCLGGCSQMKDTVPHSVKEEGAVYKLSKVNEYLKEISDERDRLKAENSVFKDWIKFDAAFSENVIYGVIHNGLGARDNDKSFIMDGDNIVTGGVTERMKNPESCSSRILSGQKKSDTQAKQLGEWFVPKESCSPDQPNI